MIDLSRGSSLSGASRDSSPTTPARRATPPPAGGDVVIRPAFFAPDRRLSAFIDGSFKIFLLNQHIMITFSIGKSNRRSHIYVDMTS
jgi:hypothetical protein